VGRHRVTASLVNDIGDSGRCYWEHPRVGGVRMVGEHAEEWECALVVSQEVGPLREVVYADVIGR
jgi:hypothetical protein